MTSSSSDSRNSSHAHDWWHEFGPYAHLRRLEILRKLVSGRMSSSALDVGCGTGMLKMMGLSKIVGIDLRNGQEVTVLASAEYLPFRDQSFQLVFAGEVIEHLDAPRRALRDWVRVLENGGSMIISTPNGLLVSRSWNPDHRHMLAPGDLTKTLARLGLRVNYARGFFTGLISGRRVFRWIPFDTVKMTLLRLPVPLSLSYDLFISAEKIRD